MKYKSILKIQKIKKKSNNYNKETKIYGWIKNKRTSKIGISFIDINDGSSIDPIQIIINKNKINNYKNIISKLTPGCSITVKGKIKKNIKNNKNEIYAKKINIIGKIKNPNKYPISPKYHTLEYLRNVSHLRPRTNLISSICRIRNTMIFNIHKYLQKKNFYWIPTPIITSLDTEGQSHMFEIKKIKKKNFFNKTPFLTVSGQLYLESYACSLSNVYNVGPIFRAENSNTKKHLAEFWMLEIETVLTNINKLINLSKNILSFCFKKILQNNYKDILFTTKYNKRSNIKHIENIIEKKFIETSYNEIIKILKKKEYLFKNKIKWGLDISTEQEKYLTKKYFKSAIIIKNYPKNIKPFYMKINKDNKTVSSLDIIFPNVGEIIGGSEREENIHLLNKNIKNKKLNPKKYWWYKELRKFGTIKHSGFGLGIERTLMYITNMKNIRDTIPFPRYPNYLNF